MFAETLYDSDTLTVEPGETGVIVTDGITEAVAVDIVSAVNRLTGALADVGAPLTPDRVCDVAMLLAAHGTVDVANWHDDDKTIVAFEVEPDRVFRSIDAPPAVAETQTADARAM